ncbi:MAG: hypothetical protein Kow00129_04750 [Thermoleophilia bacterium]
MAGRAQPGPHSAGVYPRLAVVCLIRRDDKWLLIRPAHMPEVWAPVGGRVEPGEDLLQAARREVLEEVALEVEPDGPCYAALVPHKGETTLAVSIACRPANPGAQCRCSEEALQWGWFKTEEWLELARASRSLWSAWDVRRGTLLAGTLLDFTEWSR